MPDDIDDLIVAVERLINQVLHWTPSRWGAASSVSEPATPNRASEHRSRGDVFHALVQRIADLAATAEGEPRRAVPRLDNDLALPDQLLVVTQDLIRAKPDAETVTAAMAAVREARTALWG